MVRSFDELPTCDSTAAARAVGNWWGLRRGRCVCWVATISASLVAILGGMLPVSEALFRYLFSSESLEGCSRVLKWRLIGLVAAVSMFYLSCVHILVHHIIFSFKSAIHLRWKLDAHGERLREARMEARQRARCKGCPGSAGELLSATEWSKMGCASCLLFVVPLLVFSGQLNRCSGGPRAPCCIASLVSDDSCDKSLLLGLVVGLPFALATWFVFDDAQAIRNEWSTAQGYDDPVPIQIPRPSAPAAGRL